ncbi:hypothetical protein pipiens_002291 [Culex pipiens pipiens]|uniref:RING-type domain-containing protein n=1 Tax=Culex pipiens pipiens TaxID=38569 RepID=A0ABD1DHG2_CULPP
MEEARMPDYEFELDACIICTEGFRGRATVRLDCRHRFCADCIRQLVKLEGGSPQQAKCPLCRQSIDETILVKGRSGSMWVRAVMFLAGGALAVAGAYVYRWRL